MFINPHYDPNYDPTKLPYLIYFLHIQSLSIKYRKARDSDELIFTVPKSVLYKLYKNNCLHFNYPTFDEKVFKDYLIQKESGITYVKSNGVMRYRFEKVNFEKALTHFSPFTTEFYIEYLKDKYN